MENILNFLVHAIKWLSKPIAQINTSSAEEKYVPSEVALAAIDLSLAFWISLYKQYKEIANAKRSGPLLEAHQRVKAAIVKYEELRGFDLSQGNPYLHLIALNAMTREELIEKKGDRVVVISSKLVELMAIVILTYNFFKKYKVRAGELFITAESDMRKFVEDNKLPGRFSWNKFIEQKKKQKSVQDFSFMDEYASATPSGPQRFEGNKNPEDERSILSQALDSPNRKTIEHSSDSEEN